MIFLLNLNLAALESFLKKTANAEKLSDQLKALNVEIEEILTKSSAGDKLSRNDFYRLITVEEDELPILLATANLRRIKFKNREMTFSKKVFIPLTNLCRNRCNYCEYRREFSEKDSIYLSPQTVLDIAQEGKKAGCTEALFTLGEKPELKYPQAEKELHKLGYATTIEYLRNLCEMVYERTGLFPHSNPGVLSREEVSVLREVNVSLGLMLESISERLCDKGQPHEFSPGKYPDLRIATIRYAGELKVAFTSGILLGIGETVKETVDSLLALKEIDERYGHIQEIIIQPFRPKKETPMEKKSPPSTSYLLKTIAIARLIFDVKTSIQSPPNLVADTYNILPLCGVDDWGGISPVTVDHVNPDYSWPKIDDLEDATSRYGFSLHMRLPIYPTYIINYPEFIPVKFEKLIIERVDGSGYVKV